MSGVLSFTSDTLVFEVAIQEMLLDHLILVAKRAWCPSSHGTITIKEMFSAGYHPQSAAQPTD